MLRDVPLRAVYRSESEDLLTEFYVPCLRESIRYDRAVGFFSAATLSYAAQGITTLIDNGGSMRLIFGGEITQDEADAIHDGYVQREAMARLGAEFLSVIDNLSDALAHSRLRALACLVAAGKLDVKVALKVRGMYHEKIGIFTDADGDQVVFHGSANETVHALLPGYNFESISVFPSWRPEFADHSRPYIGGFERLWENKTPATQVLPFPEAARRRLIQIAARTKPPSVAHELDAAARLFAPPPTPSAELRPIVPATINATPWFLGRPRNGDWDGQDAHRDLRRGQTL
jgi:hypothetical protein